MSPGWSRWIDASLADIRAGGRWRTPRDLDASGPEGVLVGTGQSVVSFASNDYLGLAAHPSVVAAAHDALDRWGAGSGAARLVVGSRPIHTELEGALAEWKGTERAVLYPTGFTANLGVLSALAGPGVRVVSDELNHASIIDGCRLARAEVRVYRHGDADHAAALVQGAPRAIVVSETVFSMDGDEGPVAELGELCASSGALLVLDDAHGVLARHDRSVPDGVEVVWVGTLSKTLGSLGGFAASSGRVADLLVNRSRPYIFTTAPAPASAAAALAGLAIIRSAEGDLRRGVLRGHVERVRPGHPSPIIPIVVGAERAALDAAATLLAAGLLVPAIRPPTVPPGSSRLRVTLSAAHTAVQVDRLLAALAGTACRAT